jgi:uncharacterized protein
LSTARTRELPDSSVGESAGIGKPGCGQSALRVGFGPPRTPLTGYFIGGTFNRVKITFDPGKRRAALSDRGLDFDDAAIVFAGPTITAQDTRRDYGEARFQTVGSLADRMVMVVWTPRDEARHVISMRKCNDREKAIYQERFSQG